MTAAPVIPDRADRSTFVIRSIAQDDWRKNFNVPEMVAALVNVYSNAVSAFNDAVSAAASAITATNQATNAAASAATASTQASNASASAANASTSANNAAASAATAGSAVAFVDSNPVVKGSADPTKMARFEVDGLTTGTTRVITVPNADITLAGLGSNTFTGAQIYSDQQTSRAMFIDCAEVFVDRGNSGTATINFNYASGSHQKITVTGAHTWGSINWPPTGNTGIMLLEVVNGGAFAITTPAWIWTLANGTTTTSMATFFAQNTGRTALQTSGADLILLMSRDAGTTVYASLVNIL